MAEAQLVRDALVAEAESTGVGIRGAEDAFTGLQQDYTQVQASQYGTEAPKEIL